NVRRADQFNHLLGTYKTIAKDHVGFNSKIVRQLLQVNAVFVTLAPQDMRVSCASNHVNNIAVARQNVWQSLDDIFYALIGREQAKREQNVFSFRSEPILVEVGISERQIGDAMWNQIDLVDR